MEDKYILKFQEELYPKAFREAAEKTICYFNENEEQIAKEWRSKINQHIDVLVQMQEDSIAGNISEMDISFLYSSIGTGASFRLDSYGEGGRVYSPSVYTTILDGSWLVVSLEQLGKKLAAYVSEEGIRRYIRPAYIETFKYRAAGSLLGFMATRFKYTSPLMLDTRKLARIKKCENFAICMGEYMDWQNVLYAILPSVDIFNCDEGISLRFRRFVAIYYSDKEFVRLELGQSKFTDCTFKDVTIEKCGMNDCIFDGCTFENVRVTNTKLAGSLFNKCKLSNVKFDKAIFTLQKLEGHEQEYFEPAKFDNCDFTGYSFNECSMEECIIDSCDFKKTSEA